MTSKEKLKSYFNGQDYDIPVQSGVELIQEYIKEKKGVEVTINTPQDLIQEYLYRIALETIIDFYKE